MRTILIATALPALTAFSAAFASATPKGDPGRGQQVYGLCFVCLTVDQNRIRLRTAGAVGRRVGSVPGFNYSPALREAGAAGLVKDPQQRAELIAYMKT